MIEILSLIIIVFVTFLTGQAFRTQFKENTLATCLAMLVVMLMSTSMGILSAMWIQNMVLATLLAIGGSTLLVIILLYKLPLKFFIESSSALLMGAMMGAMLILMATGYELVAIIFFTGLYVVSAVIAIGFWNLEEYPHFAKAIPISVIGVATIGLSMLIILGAVSLLEPTNTVPNQHQYH